MTISRVIFLPSPIGPANILALSHETLIRTTSILSQKSEPVGKGYHVLEKALTSTDGTAVATACIAAACIAALTSKIIEYNYMYDIGNVDESQTIDLLLLLR